MAKIYLNKDFATYMVNPVVGQLLHVADVEPKQLETIYYMCQNVEENWINHDGIRCVIENVESMRSLSVGDVIKVDDKFFILEPVGFSQLQEEKFNKLLSTNMKDFQIHIKIQKETVSEENINKK